MRVLLTNDDGIWADGLQTLRRALLELDGIQVAVIARHGYDRPWFRSYLESVAREQRLIASATSEVGTGGDMGRSIAAVTPSEGGGCQFEKQAPTVSYGEHADDLDFRLGREFDFGPAARFAASVVDRLDEVPLPEGTLLNINVPGVEPEGVEVARLGKRIYRDELRLKDEQGPRRQYWIYGADPGYEDEPGTDLAAVAQRRIAVTPLHFDLTDVEGMGALRNFDLARLLAPAAEEVEPS